MKRTAIAAIVTAVLVPLAVTASCTFRQARPTMQTVHTSDAPAAIGPYSQAVVANGFVFTAGQVPFDPHTMQLVEGDIGAQTEQVMKNITAILRQAGVDLSSVVKTTVFLRDMNDFGGMNDVYARHFGDHKPARSTVQVARLPRDVAVEIEAVAVLADR
ncbi:MAG TPA: RidA family protein [Longimicrobium sp.]|nr:RidA family protein [Longimicrobium sp.]